MIVTGEQLRAARAMARIEQGDLAQRANVSVDTIKRLERTEGQISANVATMNSIVDALEAAGIEFTNGGQPGVRVTALWMLHRVAERANLDDVLKMKGRYGYWKITPTATGLECKNQHGEIMGSVVAGRPDHPTPKFDPDMVELTFPDRVTPTELQIWIAEMLTRNSARGRAARAFDSPTILGDDRNAENSAKPKGKRK